MQFIINSQNNNTGEAKTFQPEEIVIIQVRRERVLSENRLERKRQSDQRKQEVKGVKRVEENAQEIKKDAKISRIRREGSEREQKRHN